MFETQYKFPDPHTADSQGLLAVGGDLSPIRLLTAYYSGIFPWFDDSQPILWWSPNPRFVLFPENLHVSKSMQQLLHRRAFRITYNEDFQQVIQNCASVYRPGQDGTWITQDMINAYIRLNEMGYAKSIEVWQGNELAGGLYGIYLKDKQIFCGESMFSKASNASKYGFIQFVHQLQKEGVKLIDCQVYTHHLESLGAEEISREEFLKYLA